MPYLLNNRKVYLLKGLCKQLSRYLFKFVVYITKIINKLHAPDNNLATW